MKPATPKAPELSPEERGFLVRACKIGRRGWGRVHPNPLVGCIVVQDGVIVGEGWHEVYGGPHAEVVALLDAGVRARGSTVYVSLEPCRHEGKTPPCTRALVSAGVSRVVFGAADPGSDSGGGADELRSAGVEVVGPALSGVEAQWENPFFFHRDPTRPWLSLKLALSLDGRISSEEGRRTLLSGGEATRAVHRLRAGFDAILVGTRTALVDDPRLTVRGSVTPRIPPRRILLDSRGRIPDGARVFREPGGEVWIVTTEASEPHWRHRMERLGARVLTVKGDPSGKVDIRAMLARLRAEGLESILCEGGGRIGVSLLEAGAVDRLELLVSLRFLGGSEGVPAFPEPAAVSGEEGGLQERWRRWQLGGPPESLGSDLWISLRPEGI